MIMKNEPHRVITNKIIHNKQNPDHNAHPLCLSLVLVVSVRSLHPKLSAEKMANKSLIFKIIDPRISFYSRNSHLLPPKPKSSFRHLKRGIQDFHMNHVLVPADKAANNVVVV